MGVHGKDIRQGQGGQPEGQHLAHGNIQQRQRESTGGQQLPFFAVQGRFFLIFNSFRRFFLLFRMQNTAKACFFHFFRDLFRADLGFVVAYGHNAGSQIDVATLYAGEPPGHFLHGRAARRAMHPGNVIFFLFHGTSCVVGNIPPGGIFAGINIYPPGGICQEPFFSVFPGK